MRSAVLWPREHGAWGLLAAPLLLGTVVGARVGGDRWLAWACIVLAAFAVFLARTPLEALLGGGVVRATGAAEVAVARARLLLWSAVALAAGAAALYFISYKVLALLAALGAAAYASQWLLARAESQVVVAAAFALGAPAAYVALTGRADGLALQLAALTALVTVNQVAYVQLELAAARQGGRARLRFGWPFFALQSATLLALGWALREGALTWVAAAAFVPLVARGYWRFLRARPRLALKRLGFSELAYSAAAVALLAAGARV